MDDQFNTFAYNYKTSIMKMTVLLFVMIFIANYSIAQECKVLKTEISTSYQGECKNGMAQGKGIAKGQDSYDGEFNKGLPDGDGTYIWANGAIYKGNWKKGMRDGKGSYVWHTANGDSTLAGVWRKDKYLGTGIPPYRVLQAESVPRYTISKGLAVGNKITFRFIRGGKSTSQVNNLNVTLSSGNENLVGTYLEIKDAVFPVSIKLNFSVPNLLNSYEYNCIFNLTINESASWDVILNI